MADTLGWIGSVLLAVCGAPQAWTCFRAGNARGISPAFVAMWLAGEVCYVVSVQMKFGWVEWMMFNYALNICFASVIAFYLVFPSNKKRSGRDR